jgi:hypothetical protein
MLDRAKRASHIDPPTSSYAIMRRACPYRGENPEPGKDFHAELDPKPGIREQPGSGAERFEKSISGPSCPDLFPNGASLGAPAALRGVDRRRNVGSGAETPRTKTATARRRRRKDVGHDVRLPRRQRRHRVDLPRVALLHPDHTKVIRLRPETCEQTTESRCTATKMARQHCYMP